MLRALSNMTVELNASLRIVRDSSASVHTASVEITRGNYDRSSRTEETASSLEQTAVAIKGFGDSIMHTGTAAGPLLHRSKRNVWTAVPHCPLQLNPRSARSPT